MKYKRTSKAGLLISIVAVAVLAAAGLLLGACAENTAIIDRAEFVDNRFSYNLTGAASFTVNDDKLYASFLNNPDIRVYDHNGVQVDTLNFGDGFHTNLSYYDGKLYSYTHGLNASSITIYNLNTDECTAYTIDPSISVPLAMTVLDGRVYLIYRSDLFDPYQQSVKFSDEDNYVYMGEKAVSLDVATFETEEIGINNVLNLKPYSETEILYYAYDDIGGYYFTVYNTWSKTFSEKTYNNTTSGTFAFDYNKSADSIVFSDFSNRKLVSVSMMEPDAQIDFMHNVVAVSGNDVQFCNGFCYVLDGVSGNVLRTEYDEAVKSNEEIIFRTPEIYSETPYGCGYNINTQMISDDEFALNILAEDSDYDICMMSSKQPFSRNIREQGAFYPLNDVPMVQEYLDACFPYLKEAAFNNGEIWMIPIAVDIPCILYNPENCEKYDIVLDDAATWQYLFDTVDRLYGSVELRDNFQLNGYQAEDDIIHRYNSYYAFQGDSISYNTPLFRDTCVMLKSNDMASESLHTRIASPTFYDNLSDYYGEYLFVLTPY
ncbi:MAG: hypothetical protein IJO91_02570, partial [Oscillospiraceae bacterium]|nr:hypothetical protein [Oscillospiraceae bacterium]